MAQMYAEQETPAPSPRVTEWTPERAELVKVNEAIQSLTSLVHTALGGRSAPPTPEPRPQTAFDRLTAKLQDAAYDYLLDRIEEARTQEGGD